jgi:RND family efflux transporter MFP subunit
VRTGDLLLTIDDRDIAAQQSKADAAAVAAKSSEGVWRAARDGAAANAQLATLTFDRYKALRARNSVSPQEFDEVEGRYRTAIAESERAARAYEQSGSQRQVAAADVATAGAMLSWTRIAAPYDGVITTRWVDPGAQATPGMPLLAIESTQRYRVDASIDEEHAASIRLGDSVAVSLRSGSAIAAGTVSHIAPAPDPTTRSYRLQIALPAGEKLTSGASVRVRFPMGQRKGIAIPRTAIVDRGELHEVWTVAPGDVVRMRYVTTGAESGELVEILSGLSAGDRIVVDGRRALTDGARVAASAAEGDRS